MHACMCVSVHVHTAAMNACIRSRMHMQMHMHVHVQAALLPLVPSLEPRPLVTLAAALAGQDAHEQRLFNAICDRARSLLQRVRG